MARRSNQDVERMYTAGQASTSRGCYSDKSAEKSKEKGEKLDSEKRGNHRQLVLLVLLETDFRKAVAWFAN